MRYSFRTKKARPDTNAVWYLPDKKKDAFDKSIRIIQHQVENHDNTCLFVTGENGEHCGQAAVLCHSIPKKSVLWELRDSKGKVFELGWDLSSWIHMWIQNSQLNLSSPTAFKPRKLPISAASTARFACQEHDQVFKDIDRALHEAPDWKVAVLTAYRTALYVNDRWRKYAVFLSDYARAAVKQYGNSSIVPEWKGIEGRLGPTHSVVNNHMDRLGRLWAKGQGKQTGAEGHSLCFQSKLRFAASVMLGVTGTYVTVCPGKDDSHSMTISYLREDKPAAIRSVKGFERLAKASQVADSHSLEVVRGLLEDGSGSIAVSPRSYAGLTGSERETIQELILESSQARLLQKVLNSRNQP